MHLVYPPPPHPTPILHNLCFSFLLDITAVPKEIFFPLQSYSKKTLKKKAPKGLLLIFVVTLFKIDQNKNQNRSIDKVQNLGNERR